MEIKVLGLHASPRNGATAESLRIALDIANTIPDVESEFVELRKLDLHYCKHCERCLKPDILDCPAYDDGMNELYPKIQAADVLVLASPVYNMGSAPLMSLFFSRTRPLGKLTSRGIWATKVGVGIAVAGARNGGVETTLDEINHFFLSKGMCIAGGGVYSYNGGSIWSRNQFKKGTDEDLIGRATISMAVRRAIITSRLIKLGLEQDKSILPIQLAGFTSQEEFEKAKQRIFNPAPDNTQPTED